MLRSFFSLLLLGSAGLALPQAAAPSDSASTITEMPSDATFAVDATDTTVLPGTATDDEPYSDPITAPTASVTAETRRWLHHCDDVKWMSIIEAQAWGDAEALASAAVQWNPGKKWQPAMDLFMGNDSVNKPYKSTIQSMLDLKSNLQGC
jgi:hypothetical protein